MESWGSLSVANPLNAAELLIIAFVIIWAFALSVSWAHLTIQTEEGLILRTH
jgi:hypothetical protein